MEKRTYFEFGEGSENLVLLIPYNRQEDFLTRLSNAFNVEKKPGSVGDSFSMQGALTYAFPEEGNVKH